MNPHGRRGLCLRPVPGSSGPRVALCPIFVDSAIQEVPSLWTHVSSVPPPLPPGQDHEVRAGHSFCTPSNLIAAHLAHPTTPEHIQPSEVKERSFDSFQKWLQHDSEPRNIIRTPPLQKKNTATVQTCEDFCPIDAQCGFVWSERLSRNCLHISPIINPTTRLDATPPFPLKFSDASSKKAST